MERFSGTVKALAPVNVDTAATWIKAIPFSEWHQQAPSHKGQLRPAMMTDPDWHGFKAQTDAIVNELLTYLPGCEAYQRMLSVVMPGDEIPTHIDEQPGNWQARVHVPLVADDAALFVVGETTHQLTLGTAYLVNTLSPHSVTNTGTVPRIHFMFDIRG